MANTETILRDNEIAFILNDGTQVIMNIAAYMELKSKNHLPASVESKTVMPVQVNATVTAMTASVPEQKATPVPVTPKAPTSHLTEMFNRTFGVYAIEVPVDKLSHPGNIYQMNSVEIMKAAATTDLSKAKWFETSVKASDFTVTGARDVSLISCSWNRKFDCKPLHRDRFAVRNNYSMYNSKIYTFVKASDFEKFYKRCARYASHD